MYLHFIKHAGQFQRFCSFPSHFSNAAKRDNEDRRVKPLQVRVVFVKQSQDSFKQRYRQVSFKGAVQKQRNLLLTSIIIIITIIFSFVYSLVKSRLCTFRINRLSYIHAQVSMTSSIYSKFYSRISLIVF